MMLAMIALGLKILIPPGYMAAPPQAEGPGFSLMLCTAQGMVDLAIDDPAPTEDEDGARHSPCVFAGHSLGVAAPDLLTAQPVVFQPTTAAHLDMSGDIAPGRGLASPPPPARGPPLLQA